MIKERRINSKSIVLSYEDSTTRVVQLQEQVSQAP